MAAAKHIDLTLAVPPLTDGPMAQAAAVHLTRKEAERVPPTSTLRQKFSGSTAMTCPRRRALKVLKVPADHETTWQQRLTFDVGHGLHARLEEIVVEDMGGVVEQARSWAPQAPMWGYADADVNLTNPAAAHDVVGEFKTMAPYGFENAVGTAWYQNDIPGPKLEHVTQTALYALAPSIHGTRDRIWLVYVNKTKPEIAEWVIGVDDELPNLGGRTPRQLAMADLAKVAEITEQLDTGLLPAREFPDGRTIDDPSKVNFPCGYCDWRDTCATLPSGPCSAQPLNARIEASFNAPPAAAPTPIPEPAAPAAAPTEPAPTPGAGKELPLW